MKYLNQRNEFDCVGWVNDVQKYEKNIKALKCKATTTIKRSKSGETTFDIKLINAPPQYAKALTKLATDICSGALQWILISYSYSVAKDDMATESKKISQAIHSVSEELINILLSNGLTTFKNSIRDRVNLLTAQYELSRMTYTNNKWRRWNGDVWNGTQWINTKGETYVDDAAIYLSKIVKVI